MREEWVFLFYFPSAKIDAFPQAECREHLALEISLPKLFYFFKNFYFVLPVGCLGLMSQFLALMCLHVPVPRVPSRGPGGVSWCQGEELESHGAQCPVQVSLAWGLSDIPHPPQMLLARPFWSGIYAGPGCAFCQIALIIILFQNDFVILRG